ncbi:MAG TPA: glycosyl hydrolase family 28 protein [Hanamia sp.]
MKKKLLLIIATIITYTAFGQDFYASNFGVKDDGVSLNTRSIQKAIDYVSEHGGGRVVFTPGTYVTGSIYIKSGVTLHLEGGATILGSVNPYDYVSDSTVKWKAMIFSIRQKNIGITGLGTINGRGFTTAMNTLQLAHRGLIDGEDLSNDRVREWRRPENIYFRECKNIKIDSITLRDPASWNQTYDQCENLLVDNIKVDSKSYWNNDGIDIVDCKHVNIRNSYFDAADDVLCLKSQDATKVCEDILIENCVARSSANALKFGTVSRGGFKDVTVRNLTVIDTYRSAIALEAVDGGFIENVLIDGVKSINTGNVIFLRVGDRWSSGDKKSYMKNIIIKNVYAEVPLKKADKGYNYEGPIEDLPRNISPSSIMGLPGNDIENVLLENIEILYPGGGDPFYAHRGLMSASFDSIPEMPKAYPEFSQFKELPAWGFFLRHVKNIEFKNLTLRAGKNDYRPAVVTDDVKKIEFINPKIYEPDAGKKDQIFFFKSEQTSIH